MSPKLRRWISVAFFALLLGLVYLIHEVLLPFIVSGIFVYLLAPVVETLSTKKFFGIHLSRSLAVMLVYIALGLTAGLLGLIVLPPLYQEVLKIANDIPSQLEHLRTITLPWLVNQVEMINARYSLNVDVQTYLEQTADGLLAAGQGQVEGLATHMQKLVKVLFSALSSFLVIFIVTAFVLIDLPRIKLGFYRLVPARHRQTALELVHAIDRDLSGTIRGQLMICLINGTLTTLALLMLKVKFAITIGFVAGVFSLIPVFGAVISTIPAVLIALTQSLWTALAVIGVIIIIHLIEANVLNPKILGHTVELHPAIIVFAIMVGEHFFGAVGLLFGVPVAAILRSLLRYIYLRWFAEEDPPENLPPIDSETPAPILPHSSEAHS
jgi:predicted PurR-regulated permease PerM